MIPTAGSTGRAPLPEGDAFSRSCHVKLLEPSLAPSGKGSESIGRGSAFSRRLVCPKCGAETPERWPNSGSARCSGCRIPLGRLALTNEILEVNKKTRPLTVVQDGLMGSGGAVLASLLWYALSLPRSALNGPVPQWTLEATAAWLALWVAGGIVAGLALRMKRRELQWRAIDSRVTRAASQAYFPRYAISRLIRSGRLQVTEPVAPPSFVPGS